MRLLDFILGIVLFYRCGLVTLICEVGAKIPFIGNNAQWRLFKNGLPSYSTEYWGCPPQRGTVGSASRQELVSVAICANMWVVKVNKMERIRNKCFICLLSC